MVAIGKASSDRSLADFQNSVKNFKHELEDDPVVKAHLGALYNNMVEQNLCRIVEPYSRIEVNASHSKEQKLTITNDFEVRRRLNQPLFKKCLLLSSHRGRLFYAL